MYHTLIPRPILAIGISLLSLSAAGAPADPAAPDPAKVEFFEKRVRPVLVDNCYNCHSADTNAKGGLRVDDRNGLLHGGDSGAAVVPGHPESSLLIKAVKHDDGELKMPPKKQLTPEQVADLATWIRDGAAWPQATGAAAFVATKPNPKYEKLLRVHWAWQPLRSPRVPAVKDATWVRDDLDAFVLAKIEELGLQPVGDADKIALIRRVTFDLTGLPPTPAQIESFVKDESAGAFEAVVDRLLASPQFGERWGRHWLDVARCAESTGSSRNVPYPQAWRYRDYVTDSFNRDKPFDQFVREQIAGDLLPAKSQQEKDEHLIATGFLALGVKDVNQRFKVRFVMDNIDEQIDTVTRSVLAVTASCARCHDHKFDPIPTSDYYGLAGIFASTDLCAGVRNKMGGGGLDYFDKSMLIPIGDRAEKKPAADPVNVARLKNELDKARAEWFAIRNTPKGLTKDANGQNYQRPFRLKYENLQADYDALTDVTGGGPVALGVRDAKTVGDTEIRIRGEAEQLGPVVPRGFLGLVHFQAEPTIDPAHSGRLELARWLTDAKNPLTPRVMANRVWQHLFGQGLVKSVDNFGVTGDVPSHPELLDHLASRFAKGGWSVKTLVREIVLSHTYRLSSEESGVNLAADPANRLVWRHSPRRLDAEEIRDATLAAAGKLDLSRPSASPANDLRVVELPNNGPVARKLLETAAARTHRSVYLPVLRGLTPTSLEVFDFAEQGMVTGSRETTTVATQALYLLNDPFVRKQALTLAERVLGDAKADDAGRIDQVYQLTVGRSPNAAEVRRAKAYLADYEAAAGESLVEIAVPATQPVVVADAAESGNDAGSKAKAVPANPDEVVEVEAPAKEQVIQPSDARTAAWASFCQALLGSAEFRYLK